LTAFFQRVKEWVKLKLKILAYEGVVRNAASPGRFEGSLERMV